MVIFVGGLYNKKKTKGLGRSLGTLMPGKQPAALAAKG
jgi:hypothetical protein